MKEFFTSQGIGEVAVSLMQYSLPVQGTGSVGITDSTR